MLAERAPNDFDGRTYAELIAETLFCNAMKGDFGAIREIADRI
jgi:hypothetical protein